MRTLLLLAALLTVGSCDMPPHGPEFQKQGDFMRSGEEGRFTVQFVGAFSDELAYHERRGIYVITDSKTGQEFVGVSGIGISELGAHSSMAGKIPVSVQDER